MADRVIAISDKLSDLDLIRLYMPITHFTQIEIGKKNSTFLVTPKRFWSSLYFASCLQDVIMYDGELEQYLAGSDVVTKQFMVLQDAEEHTISNILCVKQSTMDRFNVHSNKLRMLRAWIHDRQNHLKSRTHGIHGIVFPGFGDQMLADIFRHLHCQLYIQPVAPITIEDKKPTADIPYSYFELRVNYQRLLEMIAMARLCIGLPGPFTYLSIYLNIPTVLVITTAETPKEVPSFWPHVQRAYCPQGLFNNELAKSVIESSLFYEYIES